MSQIQVQGRHFNSRPSQHSIQPSVGMEERTKPQDQAPPANPAMTQKVVAEHRYSEGTDFVLPDSLRGMVYVAKCRIADRLNKSKLLESKELSFQWEPKEPHDEQYRIFMELVSDIRQLASVQQRMIAVLGSKGGVGKTPVATHLAALLALIIKFDCLIIDANHNEGTTGAKLGINRKGRTLLLAAIKNIQKFVDYNVRLAALGRHDESGLWTLLSNSNSIVDNVTIQDFITMLQFLIKGYYHSIVNDTGNGNAHAINNGSMYMADVAIFSALADKPESIDTALTSMLGFFDLGHAEKVHASLKVISATSKRETRKMYLERFRQAAITFASSQTDPRTGEGDNVWFNKADELLTALGITEDKIFLVPFSRYIADNGIVSLKRRYTGMPALIAYLRILKRIFEMKVPSMESKYDNISVRLFDTKALQSSGGQTPSSEGLLPEIPRGLLA